MPTINNINNTIAAANFTVPAGSMTVTGAFTTSGGAVSINSGTNAYSVSTDASNTTLNVGTGAAIKTIAIGSSNTTSTLTANFGGSSGSALTTYIAPTSWTPDLRFGGLTTGITYADRSGTYEQFGNTVFFTGRILLTNKGSATGNGFIFGLPGNPVALGSNATAIDVVYSVYTSADVPIHARVLTSGGVAVIQMTQAASGATFTGSQASNFANTTELHVSGHYYV